MYFANAKGNNNNCMKIFFFVTNLVVFSNCSNKLKGLGEKLRNKSITIDGAVLKSFEYLV